MVFCKRCKQTRPTVKWIICKHELCWVCTKPYHELGCPICNDANTVIADISRAWVEELVNLPQSNIENVSTD